MVSVWAYAYEMLDDPLVSDAEFDLECIQVDLGIDTGNATMDKFFKDNFDPFTGQWVHKHPDKLGLHKIYNLIKEQRQKEIINNELEAYF
jgi:hypothetical protein